MPGGEILEYCREVRNTYDARDNHLGLFVQLGVSWRFPGGGGGSQT